MAARADPLGCDVAVIGAGMAGLACAERLAAAGLAVVVFDKSRGLGGRLATRRAPAHHFDHGAQYFTARDPDFRRAVTRWREAGTVAPWPGRVVRFPEHGGDPEPAASEETRWVGVPGMSAAARALAVGLDVRRGVRVTSLRSEGQGWRVLDGVGRERIRAGAVAVAVPAPQAVPLLAPSPGLAKRAGAARLAPCWAVLVGFDAPVGASFDAASLPGPTLAWLARNASKPGRPAGESWTLHATPEWSERHLEDDPDAVAAALLDSARDALDPPPGAPVHLAAHRWRHALVTEPADEPALWDAERALGACGDWCIAPRVEAAWQSGRALAERIGASRAAQPP